jgi:hypothetical protein
MGRLDCLEHGAADQAVKMADMNWEPLGEVIIRDEPHWPN